MKKVLLSLSIIGLISLTACKDDKKANPTPSNVDSTAQKSDSTATAETSTSTEAPATTTASVPTFSDPEVQKYVQEYDAYVKEYLAAAKSKDMTKLGQLGQKAQEWATKSQTIGQKLASNPEDMKKYQDYIQELAKEMTAAMNQQ